MLGRSRVGTSPDLARMGAALARPGMDPRIWISLAYVTSVKIDATVGPVVGVTLVPSEVQDIARVGAIYAGNGWGIYAPIYVDDQVLVAVPSGEPDDGMVVIARLWTAADKAPPEVAANDRDFTIHAQDGVSVQIAVTGGGTINLGADQADTNVVRFSDLKAWEDRLIDKLAHHSHQVIGIPTSDPSSGSPPTFFNLDPGPLPDEVGSKTALVGP